MFRFLGLDETYIKILMYTLRFCVAVHIMGCKAEHPPPAIGVLHALILSPFGFHMEIQRLSSCALR